MASSLLSLVNNLAGRIHEVECKNKYDNKKYNTRRIKYRDCERFLEYNVVYVVTRIIKKSFIKT